MRLLLKLSGETLGSRAIPWTAENLRRVASGVRLISKENSVAVVTGGGNVWRYRDNTNLPLERKPSDFLGMLATVYNTNCLKAALIEQGIKSKIFTKIEVPKILAEKYTISAAKKAMKNGYIVLLAGGTGKSGFTTDTGSALYAKELDCKEIWKATKVEGVYNRDPFQFKTAKLIPKISYKEYLKKGLGVVDVDAVEVCKKEKIPMRIFKFSLHNFHLLERNVFPGSIISD